MNTSRLLGLAAIAIGVGGFAYYFLEGEGRTVVRRSAPGLQAAPPPGTIIPSTPRLTRSPPRKTAPSGPTQAQRDALPPMSAATQRATIRAERERKRRERAQRRQALIDARSQREEA